MSSDIERLQAEHCKLQQSYCDLKKSYDLLSSVAALADRSSDSRLEFMRKVVAKIAEVYDKNLYSDITIHCDGHQLRGHRLVISMRTDFWDDLSSAESIVFEGHVDALNFLMQNGAEINHRVQKTGKNLLHIAASTKCSKELLDWTPLLYAVELENVDVVGLFLKNSLIDVNITDQKGRSPISCALFEVKNMAVAEMIAAAAGADLDIKYADEILATMHATSGSCTPFSEAVLLGKFQCAELLLRVGADVNECDSNGRSLLMRAVSAGLDDAAVFLLDHGANLSEKKNCFALAVEFSLLKTVRRFCRLSEEDEINEILATMHATSGSCTPFSEAVLLGKFQCAELLLRVGADVNECDPNGRSLLMRAVSAGLDDAAVFLLEHGANLSEKGCDIDAPVQDCDNQSSGDTPLLACIRSGFYDVARCLVERGARLDKQFYCRGCDIDAPVQDCDNQSSGDTPLLACIRSGFYDVARCLVESGARLDKQDAEGRTCIHLAVQMQNSAILNVILSNCNPSLLLVVDRNGNTPLHLAWMAKSYPIADALIKKAPDLVTQFDRDGDTLLHKAVKTADLEWILFLISANSDVNSPTHNASHLTALHISAQSGSEIIMRNLILAGANVNAISGDGFTPLHLAAFNNHEALCMILLENGAQPNLTDQLGNTPLHTAVLRGSVASVNVLVANPQINLRVENKKGQNPLFNTAGDLSRTNSLDILQMFLNADPEFPLDARDIDGFTVFLMAYLKGNENFCRSLLRCGACLGVISYTGVSVFKHKAPTKQLLFSLLGTVV
ncbi:unnamed protein product [Gongylonema pulchrum]|uniref:ANK_REP_REGION domain-containing protein n=1 Tax=Gongylonema pulchrum TaxID=637853 RepID=A0A183DRH0_9BILA|nr:unnamed protein product [Gongylonema pulchrum]